MKKSQSRIQSSAFSTNKNKVLDPGAKARLLRSAEALFSSKGFKEVSVREIAEHAGVNSALISYYFGRKQALFDEVFHLHAASLSQECLRQLNAITQNGRNPSLEEILKAWLLPWLQLGSNQSASAIHLRITANLSQERWEFSKEIFNSAPHVHRAFIQALHSCLPHLSKETLMWRLHFVMGALIFGIRQPAVLRALSGGSCNPDDLDAAFIQILPYAVAGLGAPESRTGS
jgi:AcrR family transcriptional regulator